MKYENTVVLEGKKLEIKGYGTAIPFIGAIKRKEKCWGELGIGIFFPESNTGDFWGLLAPHTLIQSWRAMKILEEVDFYDWRIYGICWESAEADIHHNNKHYLDKLTGYFKNVEKCKKARIDALNSTPTAKELQSMLQIMQNRRIDVFARELEEEIRRGNIKTSPLIEKIKEEQGVKTEAIALSKTKTFLRKLGLSS